MNKLFKKSISLLLLIAVITALVGCGEADKPASDNTDNNKSSSSQDTQLSSSDNSSSQANGEIDYINLDTSQFDSTKYDGSLYINGQKFTTPFTIANLKEKNIFCDIWSGNSHIIEAGSDADGNIGFEEPVTMDNYLMYVDISFYNSSDEDINTETQSTDPIQIGQILYELNSNAKIYVGIDDLKPDAEGEYLLFVEDILARLGNPKYIIGGDYGLWYWYTYQDYSIMYELHKDDDYDDRWRATAFYYGLPYRGDEEELLRITKPA